MKYVSGRYQSDARHSLTYFVYQFSCFCVNLLKIKSLWVDDLEEFQLRTKLLLSFKLEDSIAGRSMVEMLRIL